MLLLAEALAVVALIAFALACLVLVRRAAAVLADARETESFRRAVADLAARIQATLDSVVAPIDGVRRHSVAAETIVEGLEAASASLAAYADEAKTIRGPERAAEIREAILLELDRAARALQMVEHGCGILGSVGVGGRELEAQTSIKRGYLNILHAREALARHAARAAALGALEERRLFARRNT
ncbi:MAG: hypothetical protein M3067_14105 [Chloroflexota bacterium]|nr:hypothetical protein [Chloroflexota bacterium]